MPSNDLLSDTIAAVDSEDMEQIKIMHKRLMDAKVTPTYLVGKLDKALVFWINFIDYRKASIIKKAINSGFLTLLIDNCYSEDQNIRLALCELWAENKNNYTFTDVLRLYRIYHKDFTANDFYKDLPVNYQLGVLI